MEKKIIYEDGALEYIAKIADGGMRDAITLLDKCLAYSSELTLENVVNALGTVDYTLMFNLTDALFSDKKSTEMIQIIEDLHGSGKDLKQFLKQYVHFLLDVQKYAIGCDWKYMTLPQLPEYVKWLESCGAWELNKCMSILRTCLQLSNDIKYSATPKLDIETALLLEYTNEVEE